MKKISLFVSVLVFLLFSALACAGESEPPELDVLQQELPFPTKVMVRLQGFDYGALKKIDYRPLIRGYVVDVSDEKCVLFRPRQELIGRIITLPDNGKGTIVWLRLVITFDSDIMMDYVLYPEFDMTQKEPSSAEILRNAIAYSPVTMYRPPTFLTPGTDPMPVVDVLTTKPVVLKY